MKIKIFGSGSSGNMYCLTDVEGNNLILDAGVNIIELKKYLDFKINNISAMIMSHRHS